jgi:hypothetical protein
MKITIGADELILWLRKNNKAVGEDNFMLGRKIIGLIKSLDGQPALDDYPSLWVNDLSDAAMAKLGLPKTSEQYNIDTSSLQKLYETLAQW